MAWHKCVGEEFTEDNHNITDRVEGQSTHNHDIQRICSVVKGDVVIVKGDVVDVKDDVVAVRDDVVMPFLPKKYGP